MSGNRLFAGNTKPIPVKVVERLEAALTKLNHQKNYRYSQAYLDKTLGLKVGRGGILRVKNPLTNQFELYEFIKTDIEINYDIYGNSTATATKKKSGKAQTVGAPGSFGKIKVLRPLGSAIKNAASDVYVVKVNEKISHPTANDPIPALKEKTRHEAEGLERAGAGFGGVITKLGVDGREEENDICIIMKRAPGQELFDVLRKDAHKLSVDDYFQLALKILLALRALHQKNMLHRDLKPENMLYDIQSKELTIIDYDMWQEIGEPFDKCQGTPGFIATEIYSNSPYTAKSDVFALGRIIQDLFGIPGRCRMSGQTFGRFSVAPAMKLLHTQLERFKHLTTNMLFDQPSQRISLDDAIRECYRIYQSYSPQHAADFKKTTASLQVVIDGPAAVSAVSVSASSADVDAANRDIPVAASAMADPINTDNQFVLSALSLWQRKLREQIGKKSFSENYAYVSQVGGSLSNLIIQVDAYLANVNAVANEDQAKACKRICLSYLSKAIERCKIELSDQPPNSMALDTLLTVANKLLDKVNSLPRFGSILSRSDSPKPSKTMQLLTAFSTELVLLKSNTKKAVMNLPFLGLAFDCEMRIKQQFHGPIISIDGDLNAVMQQLTPLDFGPDFNKKNANDYKDKILACALRLVTLYRCGQIDLAQLVGGLSSCYHNTRLIPHTGPLSSIFKKDRDLSPTATLLQELHNYFYLLSVSQSPVTNPAQLVEKLISLCDKDHAKLNHYKRMLRYLTAYQDQPPASPDASVSSVDVHLAVTKIQLDEIQHMPRKKLQSGMKGHLQVIENFVINAVNHFVDTKLDPSLQVAVAASPASKL